MSNVLFQKIRTIELRKILVYIPQGSRVLEVGAGAGWQAKVIHESGFTVEAIDIDSSEYIEDRVWPITVYDGKKFPFPDNSFDEVFSSNVLEHIPEPFEFQSEIRRVLKNHGLAIHIVPTGSWRFWNILAYYPFILKTLLKLICCRNTILDDVNARNALKAVQKIRCKKEFVKAMFPSRHGVYGNAISEIYRFSKNRWDNSFNETGWKIVDRFPNRLFYTGYFILDSYCPIWLREKLSRILGSSCHNYILIL